MSTNRDVDININVRGGQGGRGGGQTGLALGQGPAPKQPRPARSSAGQQEAVSQIGQLAQGIPGGGRAAGAVRGIAAGAAVAPLLGVTAAAGGAALALGAVAVSASKASDALNTSAALERRAARARYEFAKQQLLSATIGDRVAQAQTAAMNSLTRIFEDLLGTATSARNNAPIPAAGGGAPVAAPPGFQAGGIIPGSRTGRDIRAGEGGRSEAIVPLSGNDALKTQIADGFVRGFLNPQVQAALNRFEQEDVPFRSGATAGFGVSVSGTTSDATIPIQFLTIGDYNAIAAKDDGTLYAIIETPPAEPPPLPGGRS